MKQFCVRVGTYLSILLSCNSIQAQAQTPTEYLNAASLQLSVLVENAFNDATRDLYRKYCPEQSDQILNAVNTVIQSNPKISWAWIASAEEEWLKESLHQCENWIQVDTYLRAFVDEMDVRTKTILQQVKDYIDIGAAMGTLFEESKETAEILLNTLIEVQLNGPELLKFVESGKENNSLTRSEWLWARNQKAKLAVEGELPAKQAQTRCFKCNKKSHILLDCRCKNSFCIRHRAPETHECSFDHRNFGKDIIEKQNPKIEKPKVETI